MEHKSEILPPVESQLDINSDLRNVLNEALNNSIGAFSTANAEVLHTKKVEKYLEYLDKIGFSIVDYDPSEDGMDFYSVREQRLDPQNDIFYIKLAPEISIDRSRATRYGSPSLNLIPGPVDECQIAIKPFCEYKGAKPDPSRLISQTGFEVDFSVSNFSLTEGKIGIKSRIAGVGVKIYQDGRGFSFLKTYIGTEDFQSKKIPLKDDQSIRETLKYLSSVGLSDPVVKYR